MEITSLKNTQKINNIHLNCILYIYLFLTQMEMLLLLINNILYPLKYNDFFLMEIIKRFFLSTTFIYTIRGIMFDSYFNIIFIFIKNVFEIIILFITISYLHNNIWITIMFVFIKTTKFLYIIFVLLHLYNTCKSIDIIFDTPNKYDLFLWKNYLHSVHILFRFYSIKLLAFCYFNIINNIFFNYNSIFTCLYFLLTSLTSKLKYMQNVFLKFLTMFILFTIIFLEALYLLYNKNKCDFIFKLLLIDFIQRIIINTTTSYIIYKIKKHY